MNRVIQWINIWFKKLINKSPPVNTQDMTRHATVRVSRPLVSLDFVRRDRPLYVTFMLN